MSARLTSLGLGSALLIAAAGCAGRAGPASGPAPALGAETAEANADADMIAAAASDLQKLFDQQRALPAPEHSPDPSTPPETAGAVPALPPRPARDPDQARTAPAPRVGPPAPDGTPPAPARAGAAGAPATAVPGPAADDPIARMLAHAGPGADDAFATAIRLVALDGLEPGAAAGPLADAMNRLSPRQREAITALGDFVRTLACDSATQDPERVATLSHDLARRLEAARPLRLPVVALCARVESFGRYTPLASTAFPAGRPIAAVLYVEVDNFVQGPAGAPARGSELPTPAGSVVSELSQELVLYTESGTTAVWQSPEQVLRETSQRPRRDYYLVSRLQIPGTLGAGAFRLKVTVRDKIGGAVAECFVPVTIVAASPLQTAAR
ncbi:MAG TPA: hypothetical protein VD963_01355 [Phycisphaerales bacterium]|nr:hypothetical protein [Phycisphaerales bacterium]